MAHLKAAFRKLKFEADATAAEKAAQRRLVSSALPEMLRRDKHTQQIMVDNLPYVCAVLGSLVTLVDIPTLSSHGDTVLQLSARLPERMRMFLTGRACEACTCCLGMHVADACTFERVQHTEQCRLNLCHAGYAGEQGKSTCTRHNVTAARRDDFVY